MSTPRITYSTPPPPGYAKLADFTLELRAASLKEDLEVATGIEAVVFRPKWEKRNLPPPRVEVHVPIARMRDALAVYEEFRKPAAPPR